MACSFYMQGPRVSLHQCRLTRSYSLVYPSFLTKKLCSATIFNALQNKSNLFVCFDKCSSRMSGSVSCLSRLQQYLGVHHLCYDSTLAASALHASSPQRAATYSRCQTSHSMLLCKQLELTSIAPKLFSAQLCGIVATASCLIPLFHDVTFWIMLMQIFLLPAVGCAPMVSVCG